MPTVGSTKWPEGNSGRYNRTTNHAVEAVVTAIPSSGAQGNYRPPSSDGLMAGVRGVSHVGLRPISREIVSRETCAGRGTDRKRVPLLAGRPSTG